MIPSRQNMLELALNMQFVLRFVFYFISFSASLFGVIIFECTHQFVFERLQRYYVVQYCYKHGLRFEIFVTNRIILRICSRT